MVSIPPLEGLVRPLLPADAEVKVLVPPGQTPHGFELAPSDVVTVANADVVVYVGLYLEPQLEKLLRNQDTSWRREGARQRCVTRTEHEKGAGILKTRRSGDYGMDASFS